MATSMQAMATAMEATVPRAAPLNSLNSGWQIPGLGTLQAESKAGSVRLTADTRVTFVMLLNALMVKSTEQRGNKEKDYHQHLYFPYLYSLVRTFPGYLSCTIR